MWLRKDRGESGVGEHWWPEDGSVVEVPDGLAGELLGIPDGGYSRAPKPAPKTPAAAVKPAPAAPAAAKTAGKDAG